MNANPKMQLDLSMHHNLIMWIVLPVLVTPVYEIIILDH